MVQKQSFEKQWWQICYLLVSSNDRVSMNSDGFKKDKNDTEKLLGVKFERKLTFDDNIWDISQKAGLKISASARVTPYIDIAKKPILMSNFFLVRSLVIALSFGWAIVVQRATK